MRPKTAYFAMDDLVNREWRTRLTLTSQVSRLKSSGSTISFRGFRGRYRLSWKDADGKGQSKFIEVK